MDYYGAYHIFFAIMPYFWGFKNIVIFIGRVSPFAKNSFAYYAREHILPKI